MSPCTGFNDGTKWIKLTLCGRFICYTFLLDSGNVFDQGIKRIIRFTQWVHNSEREDINKQRDKVVIIKY